MSIKLFQQYLWSFIMNNLQYSYVKRFYGSTESIDFNNLLKSYNEKFKILRGDHQRRQEQISDFISHILLEASFPSFDLSKITTMSDFFVLLPLFEMKGSLGEKINSCFF
ncbi:hypothetical protein CDIK_1750 [Cucumispora dikerogammari]|nr:hypothetical protein CDIK_1750 [Cucumispora dikerogammari]